MVSAWVGSWKTLSLGSASSHESGTKYVMAVFVEIQAQYGFRMGWFT